MVFYLGFGTDRWEGDGWGWTRFLKIRRWTYTCRCKTTVNSGSIFCSRRNLFHSLFTFLVSCWAWGKSRAAAEKKKSQKHVPVVLFLLLSWPGTPAVDAAVDTSSSTWSSSSAWKSQAARFFFRFCPIPLFLHGRHHRKTFLLFWQCLIAWLLYTQQQQQRRFDPISKRDGILRS